MCRSVGNVEIPILKFLYSRRDYDKPYTVKTIATVVGIDDEDSVRGALNRLFNRRPPYVKKFRNGRYTYWRIGDANVYREVEQRIGIYKDEDYINMISDTTVELSPLKNSLQSMLPHVAAPLEVGYQILSNLNTIRNMYNLTTAISSHEFNNILNETINDVTKHTYKDIAGFIAQPIKDTIIPNIVETSSKYLKEKRVFEDITEKLNLDERYSNDFKDFYDVSLNNCLKQKFKEYINPVR